MRNTEDVCSSKGTVEEATNDVMIHSTQARIVTENQFFKIHKKVRRETKISVEN